jgi:hypothetical protein
MPCSVLASHTGAAVFHQVATLIASSGASASTSSLVVVERVHRDAQVEPVGLAGEAVERDLVPARGEPVEVLEDVAVAAADAGVLGHVDDAQAALGVAHRAGVEELRPSAPRSGAGTRARARRGRSRA